MTKIRRNFPLKSQQYHLKFHTGTRLSGDHRQTAHPRAGQLSEMRRRRWYWKLQSTSLYQDWQSNRVSPWGYCPRTINLLASSPSTLCPCFSLQISPPPPELKSHMSRDGTKPWPLGRCLQWVMLPLWLYMRPGEGRAWWGAHSEKLAEAHTDWLSEWRDDYYGWAVILQLGGAALSHEFKIPLFIPLPHKLQHKTSEARERINSSTTVSP